MYLPSCPLKGTGADSSLLPGGRERTASTAEFPCVAGNDLYAGNACSVHWHEEFEMVLVRTGTLTATVNGCEHVLRAGEGIFVNSSVLHAYKETEGCAADVLYLLFLPALIGGRDGSVFWRKYLDPLVSSLRLSGLPLRGEPWQQEVLDRTHTAAGLLSTEPEGYEIDVRSQLTRITQTICAHAVPAPESGCQTEASQTMRQMLAFLEANYFRDLRTEDIAAAAHISVRSCQRLFRKFTSQSPKQFLTAFRLEQAQRLLKDTAWSIPEIGAECGFADQSYFTKLFRERCGCPPAQFRRQHHTGG